MNEIILTIKSEIERQKLTRYKISQMSGISESQLKRWLEGITEPSISNAQRLAEAVGLKIEVKIK